MQVARGMFEKRFQQLVNVRRWCDPVIVVQGQHKRLVDGIQFVETWEASDPRLSGESTYTGNWQVYEEPGFEVQAALWELANDAGRWVGTGTGYFVGETVNGDTAILKGEGGYEGLTAYLVFDFTTEPGTFQGLIFPGEMPTFPEPPAE